MHVCGGAQTRVCMRVDSPVTAVIVLFDQCLDDAASGPKSDAILWMAMFKRRAAWWS